MDWITFPALELPGIRHGFSLRAAGIPREELDAQLRPSLAASGMLPLQVIEGEQTHGNAVAVISVVQAKHWGYDPAAPAAPSPNIFIYGSGEPVSLTPAGRIPAVDALATKLELITLVIRVADCGPVFFYDPVQRAIAVAHSGRKGTEENITAQTIRAMQDNFGSCPEDLIVQLGPCIRPPHYEVPFAAEIGNQARACGVLHFHDCAECTACDLERFYSYRAELGKTGRMWAAMMLEAGDSEVR